MDAQKKKTPRQIAGNAGVSFGLVCRNCIGSRFRQDLKLFSGKTGNLHDFDGIFGDMRGVSGDLKNRGKRRFFRIGRDFGRKRPEKAGIAVNFTDSRIGRRVRFSVFDADNLPGGCEEMDSGAYSGGAEDRSFRRTC